MSKCITIVEGVSMHLEHSGLYELLKKEANIDLHRLPFNHLVLCLNGKGTAAKLIGSGGSVLSYIRIGGKRTLTQEALENVGRVFGGPGIEFSPKVRRILARVLGAPEVMAKIAA